MAEIMKNGKLPQPEVEVPADFWKRNSAQFKRYFQMLDHQPMVQCAVHMDEFMAILDENL